MPLHTSPSLHELPSSGVLRHPDAGLQESSVQGLESLQSKGVPGKQVPPEQISGPLQTSPSSQELASFPMYTQPMTGSQESSVQVFESSQVSDVPGRHVPAEHVSEPLQTFPSSQELVSSGAL